MRTDLAAIRLALDELEAHVRAGKSGSSPLWRGAKVEITLRPSPPSEEVPFMAPDFEVATPHAEPLSWLFHQLRDAFLPDYQSKYYFFGRLADAAVARASEPTAQLLLLAVLAEARLIYDELVAHGAKAAPTSDSARSRGEASDASDTDDDPYWLN